MPVSKVTLKNGDGHVYVRHAELAWGQKGLLLLHGLGESRQIYIEAFEHQKLAPYNLIAPDLPGFGNSIARGPVGITFLLRAIEQIIEHFCDIPEWIILGHGLGGDLAAWTAMRRWGERIRGVFSVEGTLGEQALYYGDMAIEAAEDPDRTYTKWFSNTFAEQTIRIPHIGKEDGYRRFHESLLKCRAGVFLSVARDMREKLTIDPNQEEQNHAEDKPRSNAPHIQPLRVFTQLEIPTLYCLAGRGLNADQVNRLESNQLDYLLFRNSTYWPMIDEPIPFYDAVYRFCADHMPALNDQERYKRWFLLRFRSWLDRLPSPIEGWRKLKQWIRTRIKY